MNLFAATMKYRVKTLFTTPHGLVLLILALLLALSPFVGLIIPDAPVPIGWIDEDNTEYSQLLLENVEALNVVWVTHGDKKTLTANLQSGRLECVFVIKKGFEDAIRAGEFEETLQMLRSPYSTAAGVISESVGSEAMRLWLTSYSALEAEKFGGEALYTDVFEDIIAGTDEPILSMTRLNAAGETGEVTPLLDAAYTSLYLLAALACFYMLSGLALMDRGSDFAARLASRAFSIKRYRLSATIADTLCILPCVAIPLAAFILAGAGALAAPLFVMFALYVFAYGGVAALISGIRNRTALMLCICVVTIANVLFGSLLVQLPASGVLGVAARVLPSRWLTSLSVLPPLACIAGLAACAVVYNALPFLIRRREA